MKRLALLLLILTGNAWAAPPQEIVSNDRINLVIGQARSFLFGEAVGSIDFTLKDTAEAVPMNDRQISIVGLKPGITQMFVSTPSGARIYGAEIVVSPDPGHIVKIYGSNKNDDLNAGYISVYCTETGCERPDKDLPKPTTYSIERISGFKKGARE